MRRTSHTIACKSVGLRQRTSFHRRTVLSSLALASVFAIRTECHPKDRAGVPLRRPSDLCVAALHRRTVLSMLALASVVPSGLKRHGVDRAGVAAEAPQRLVRRDAP